MALLLNIKMVNENLQILDPLWRHRQRHRPNLFSNFELNDNNFHHYMRGRGCVCARVHMTFEK